jgi:hypothetical protein
LAARPKLAYLAVAVLLMAARPARADAAADAENLFARAKALMTAGNYLDACPLLKESYRLDPAQGTLLNLAACNERTGKLAAAWAQFRAVEETARRATPPREDRAKAAKERADALEPKLARVRIAVPSASRAPGLVVRVDGEEKGEPVWALGVVVDPGAHTIDVRAPGKRPVSVRFEAGAGTTQSVELPPLADLPPDIPSAQRQDPDPYAANRTQRTAGFVVGGIGLATAVVGGGFGVAAIMSNSDAKACAVPCSVGSDDAARSNEASDRALLFANVANIAVPLGLVGAAVGTYLVLTSGPTASVSLVPHGSRSAAGLDMVARW